MNAEEVKAILGDYYPSAPNPNRERISESLEYAKEDDGVTPDSEYQKFIMDRFYAIVDEWNGYGENCDMWMLLFSPEIYGVEDEMLQYVKENPKLTMREYAKHFEEIAKDIELDDDDEDEEEEDEE